VEILTILGIAMGCFLLYLVWLEFSGFKETKNAALKKQQDELKQMIKVGEVLLRTKEFQDPAVRLPMEQNIRQAKRDLAASEHDELLPKS